MGLVIACHYYNRDGDGGADDNNYVWEYMGYVCVCVRISMEKNTCVYVCM